MRWRLLGALGLGVGLGLLLGSRLPVQGAPPAPTPPEPETRSLSDDFVRIGEQVAPSVVSIDALRVTPGFRNPLADPFFPYMNGEGLFRAPEQPLPSIGSGLAVREDGYILTNHHVVNGVSEIQVTFADQVASPARLMGSDPASDLALLKVDRKGLKVAPWGESQSLKIGQWVLAFGSPYRMRGSMSHGIVSGKGRKNLGIADLEDFVQSDAALNPGNSGGPLVNLQGQVVGINTAIISQTGASHGISLSVPSEVARPVLDELLRQGRVDRSWLGLFVASLDAAGARRAHLSEATGALVEGGYTGGPAGQAGVQAGDVVLEYDGTRVSGDGQLRTLLAATPVGKKVSLLVWRAGRPQTLEVTTVARGVDSHGQPVKGI